MASLIDIQQMVNQALGEIQKRNFRDVQAIYWPQIKTALGQCVDLEWQYRGDMGSLIYKHMNDQNLQG
jgi:hypothetical protein